MLLTYRAVGYTESTHKGTAILTQHTLSVAYYVWLKDTCDPVKRERA